MEPEKIIDQLEGNLSTFQSLLDIRESEQIVWKQDPEKWCPLEIVCHLIDEEREDFRTRVKTTLESPGQQPPAIDPVGWVKSRNYMDQNFEFKKQEFFEERTDSIHYLRDLTNPNWQNSYEHQTLGKLTSIHFLTNWLAHDFLHFKQLTRLKYDYLNSIASMEIDYAGEWK